MRIPTPGGLVRGRCAHGPRPSLHHLAAAIAAALLASCSCTRDVPAEDAGADAALDARDISAAGWRPAFEPRVLFHDPTIVCPAVEAPVFAPEPPRPSVAPGEVRWVYRSYEDPAFRELSPAAPGFRPTTLPLSLAPDGGVRMSLASGEWSFDVTSDGRLNGSRVTLAGPSAWYSGTEELVARSGRDLYLLTFVDGVVTPIPRFEWGTSPVPAYPVPLPEPLEWTATDTRFVETPPALLADGSVVWSPTPSVIALACVRDGRVRTLIEHDPAPPSVNIYAPQTYALRDGTFVFVMHEVYRFDASGAVLGHGRAYDDAAPDGVVSLGYSEECGLAMRFTRGMQWWDVETMTQRGPALRWNRGHLVVPTAECGLAHYVIRSHLPHGVRSTAVDGSVTFEIDDPRTSDAGGIVRHIFALEDGGVMLLGDEDPEIVILDRDGTVRLDAPFDPAVVGPTVLAWNVAFAPDGTLYFVTSHFDGGYAVVAVETGARPLYPTFGVQAEIDWARTRGLWTIPPR